MKRIIAALLSFIILLMLPACRPTPEKGTVVQKDSDRMLEEAQKSPEDSAASAGLYEQYGIPETYAYDAQGADGKLNIHVDAQVIAPEGSAMPIYRIKAAEFSQETVSAFFNALCGDAEMWVYSGQLTKEQIRDTIVRLKERIARIKDDPKLSEDLKMTQNSLGIWEQRLETAPDTLDEDRADGTLKEISETHEKGHISIEGEEEPEETPSSETVTYMGLNAYERYDGGLNDQGRSIDVKNDENPCIWYHDGRNPAAGINFGSSPSLAVLEDADVDADILSKIGLKPGEAKRMVQDLLDETGSGMKVDSVYLQDDEQKGNYDGITRLAGRYAYRIYCVRTRDGFPCSYIMGGSKLNPEDMMSPYWPYEEMYFMVNSEGIFEMMWHNPIEVVETVNTDAQMKPFSEIREIFEKMMSIEYEAQAEFGGSEYGFDINRVTLSLHRIIEQNSNESGLLVPAWNFYGKLTIGSGRNSFEKLGESFMTINAIDGSVIDTQKGY